MSSNALRKIVYKHKTLKKYDQNEIKDNIKEINVVTGINFLLYCYLKSIQRSILTMLKTGIDFNGSYGKKISSKILTKIF